MHCDFIEIKPQVIHKLDGYFNNTFSKNTSEGLLLKSAVATTNCKGIFKL